MHYVHPALRPLGADYFQDPYEAHARLRAELPAVPVAMPGGNRVWLVTRYDEVRAALADARLFKDHRKTPGGGSGPLGANMINTDPPDHERLRRLVASAFTMRRVEQMRPRIQKITAALLDEMAGCDEVDLVDAFAFPLPVTVICELLGVPTDDRDSFRAWTGAILSGSDTSGSAASAMARYLTSLVASKREHPADDMVSALIAARDNQNRLSEEELVSTLWLLLSAGHETTVNLIGSGTLALLTHPATLTRLREDPSLLPSAVEELLRFTSPVNHGTFRMSACPVQYGNVLVPEKRPVCPAISSANRDPSRFPSPDVLDIDRDTSGHLAFGHGIHYCLGAPLARMEAVIAFGELLSRFPALKLAIPAESIRWRENTLMHGPERLPVRLRPAQSG
jgi:cytochrome P450